MCINQQKNKPSSLPAMLAAWKKPIFVWINVVLVLCIFVFTLISGIAGFIAALILIPLVTVVLSICFAVWLTGGFYNNIRLASSAALFLSSLAFFSGYLFELIRTYILYR